VLLSVVGLAPAFRPKRHFRAIPLVRAFSFHAKGEPLESNRDSSSSSMATAALVSRRACCVRER
jgi:hypothetical protein